MAESLTPQYPPLLATDVKPEWIERAKYVANQPGIYFRVVGNVLQSLDVNSSVGWQPTMPQHCGVEFASEQDARMILEMITE